MRTNVTIQSEGNNNRFCTFSSAPVESFGSMDMKVYVRVTVTKL